MKKFLRNSLFLVLIIISILMAIGLTPQADESMCTVTFDSHGSSYGVKTYEIERNKKLVFPVEIPKLDGYEFIGWADEKGGDIYLNSVEYGPTDEYVVTSDTTFHAVWNVEFNVSSAKAVNGENISIPVTISKNWYSNYFKLSLKYDKTALELISTENGDTFDKIEVNNTSSDTPTIYINGCKKEDGTAFTLNFKVKDKAPSDEYTVTLIQNINDYINTNKTYTLRKKISKTAFNLSTVEDVSNFFPPLKNRFIMIDEEIIKIRYATPAGFIYATRGRFGTSSVIHEEGSEIKCLEDYIFTKINNGTITVNPNRTSAGLHNFKKTLNYNDRFHDVLTSDWYYTNVKNAYEYSLMMGKSESEFSPGENLSLAQIITMAARLHSIYNTGEANFVQGSVWYQVYLDYCINNSIISQNEFKDFNALATRAEFVSILSRAIPSTEYPEINSFNSIIDVDSTHKNHKEILKFYNAGLLVGSDTKHTFNPNSQITRAETATIITRIIDSSLRIKIV